MFRKKTKDLEAVLQSREALLRRTKRLILEQLSRLQIEENNLEERIADLRTN